MSAKEIMQELITVKDVTNVTNEPNPEINNVESLENQEYEPRCLSEHGLLLYIKPEDKPFPPVPPPTPKELISDCYVTILPEIPDSLKDINIPCVRECGIRDSISALAKYFNCEDFKDNLVQFWFLDMLVDCIWKAQDEYKFSLQEQKVMLEWILFVIKLIKGHNMTKDLMFEIFNEALVVAENYVQAGGAKAPTPNSLFTVQLEELDRADENKAYSFMSFISHLDNKTDEFNNKPSNQYVVVKLEEDVQVFKVPNNETVIDDCLSSSIDPPSDHEASEHELENDFGPLESIQEKTANSEVSFVYKPSMSTPTRFQSLEDIDLPTPDSEIMVEKVESVKSAKEWFNIPRKQPTPECPSEIIKIPIHSQRKDLEADSSKLKDQESYNQELQVDFSAFKSKELNEEEEIVLDNELIFKIYYEYNMWQLKNESMADPSIGWAPSLTSSINAVKTTKLKTNSKIKIALKNCRLKSDDERDKNIFVNLCVLMAVKQIVFEYFNYNFSFELVRISLNYPQYLITQDVNTFWNIPKDIRGEFKKPVPKKPKKEKSPKEKKDKSSKKDKSTKGSKDKGKDKKGKDKKGKDKKGKDKKEKSQKSKSAKTSKKSGKDKKISKEEKREIDRLKKEQEDQEKQLLKEAENKMFMFPLKEAVDDSFFINLFPDYKPKKSNKKDKKQEKDNKSAKSSKTDKSSKKGKKKK